MVVTRTPAVWRCRLCPPHRVFMRTEDITGRRLELRRAARSLARAARTDHPKLFGHDLELVEERHA